MGRVENHRVEFGDRGGTAAGVRGLAAASGHSLEYVVELAQRGELRRLFAGGKTYRHRAAPEPPAARRRITPRQAQLVSRRRGWTLP